MGGARVVSHGWLGEMAYLRALEDALYSSVWSCSPPEVKSG